jgi:hypothetical protein
MDEVSRAIEAHRAALERYAATFADVLGENPPPSGPVFDRELPDAGWNDRLAAAKASADEAEHLLAEQEAVWGRWQESLAAWRRLVEQPPGDRGECASSS